MRLIRLQTDHDNCMFDNSFQDDILIQPGAKIALQNVCILKTPESVYIGNLDITITFKISGADDAAPPTVTLNTGSYDKNNFDALLSEITTKMNGALHIIRARHLGIQWKAHLVDNVVRLEYEQPFRTSLRSMMSKYSFATLNGVTTSGSQSLVAQGDSTEGTGTQFIYVNAPITKGCGIFSAKVIKLIATAGANSTGFILGLVAKQVGTISKIEKAKYLFGVATLGANSANTSALVNGGAAATAGSTAKNDFVGIEIHTNQVHMVLYKNASSSKTVIHSADIDPSVDYYPAITFFDDGSTELQSINCALDPFASPVLVNEPSSAVTVEDVQPLPSVQHIYGNTVGQVKSDGRVANALYNAALVAGSTTTTNNTFVDGSYPDGAATTSAPPASSHETHDVYTGGVLYQLLKSYHHREISQTISGLVPGVSYDVDIGVFDLDEHQLYFADAAETLKVLEELRVFANNSLVGSIAATRGGGSEQTVAKTFAGIVADSSGEIVIEISLPFVFSLANLAAAFVTGNQQGVRLEHIVASTATLRAHPLKPTQAKSIHTLEFSSMTLPNFLGYRLQTYSTATINPARFIADAMFDITDTADSFVVELLSLELDSYNSVDTPTVKTGGRRSILATVPQTEGVDGTIVYEVNYPTFIDIRNKNPVAIRNIRARILKSDLSSMIISGTATMTLLLDN